MQQDQLLAVVATFVLVSVLGLLFGLIYYFQQKGDEESQQQETEQTSGNSSWNEVARARDRRGMRGAAALRRRAAAASSSQQQQEEDGQEDEEYDEDDQNQRESTSKSAKKAAKKEDKKKAKEEARAAREAQEQAKSQKISAYEERMRQREEEREAQERAEEEERERLLEERRQKEEEEAAKWMDLIKVEGSGEEKQQTEAEAQGLLQQFVDAIIERKTVVLDDLAADFKLRTSDVINRIQGLEQMGQLTGVMDDRGKFIYISKEEMAAVANYIRSKGRVKISELAQKSNELVDLEAKEVQSAAVGEGGVELDMSVFDDLDDLNDPQQMQQSPIAVS